ncbi:MAG: PKD domain-containing protein [Deltaproteobacteria bacterium]|nr:PKD domain-containing protein [Deltaproteobacteria bacterium]
MFEQTGRTLERESKKYYVLGYCSPKRAGSRTVTLKAAGYTGSLSYSFDADGFGPGCTPHKIESVLYTPERVEAEAECVGANFVASTMTGPAPLPVTFMYDPEEAEMVYYWDFGDGTFSTSQNPSHTYKQQGTYTVTLWVDGQECAKTDLITVRPESERLCAVEQALQGRWQAALQADRLRHFRDRMLTGSLTGRLLSGLYYRASEELKTIMARDAGLTDRVADLVETHAALLAGAEPVILTATELLEIQAVLSELADRAGPMLRGTLGFVQRATQDAALLKQLGIELES